MVREGRFRGVCLKSAIEFRGLWLGLGIDSWVSDSASSEVAEKDRGWGGSC